MNIACALRWEVAFVRIFSTGHGSPYMGKYFKCRKYTGGLRSYKAPIVKKAGLWLVKFFL